MLHTKFLAPALPLLAVVGVGLAETPARAQVESLDVARTVIPLKGLDLTDAADRAILDRRIRRAANAACQAETLSRSGAHFVCLNEAMRQGQQQRDAAVAAAATAAQAAARAEALTRAEAAARAGVMYRSGLRGRAIDCDVASWDDVPCSQGYPR